MITTVLRCTHCNLTSDPAKKPRRCSNCGSTGFAVGAYVYDPNTREADIVYPPDPPAVVVPGDADPRS